MPVTVLTTEDLMEFKLELFEELKQLLSDHLKGNLRRYMRSTEVMKFLHISAGTLQNMRINGTLPYTKIGGTIYYDTEDLQRVMQKYRVDNNY
ncbi:helix-turn-helix domain-containing protein [Salegentibacter sp. LM13S]|uniref:helix-turn-helix domain-containing protein n=1 Tax=Salegentibacter lacus TaxID=2873599 RepID=UPI001CCBCA68|nr:helix-turn-helix domain-containing protein [Salegentibacter lacus]MBZ9632215.1 helix-turn-helix domain-containing protein [Salegentibacter lacus]